MSYLKLYVPHKLGSSFKLLFGSPIACFGKKLQMARVYIAPSNAWAGQSWRMCSGIGYSSHYIHTCIVYREEREERQKSDTGKHVIPPQPPWFFYVPGIQLRYTGSTFYVPIRWTMMNTMDIYNEKMNDMWESAPGVKHGASGWKARRVTARPLWRDGIYAFPIPVHLGLRYIIVEID